MSELAVMLAWPSSPLACIVRVTIAGMKYTSTVPPLVAVKLQLPDPAQAPANFQKAESGGLDGSSVRLPG